MELTLLTGDVSLPFPGSAEERIVSKSGLVSCGISSCKLLASRLLMKSSSSILIYYERSSG